MPTTPGEIALQHVERLKDELRKDLDIIESNLVEFEADSIVRRNRIKELAAVHHEHANKAKEMAGVDDDSLHTADNLGIIETQNKLMEILGTIEGEVNELSRRDKWSETYNAFRSRLMMTINTLDLIAVAQRKNAEIMERKISNEARISAVESSPGQRSHLGSSAIIRSQEVERQRIAREIHDGPAQAIANVVLRMDILAKIYEKDPSRVPDEIARMKSIAQQALDEIRGFIFDLRPMTLQDLGLVATIKRIVSQLKVISDLDVRFVVEGKEHPLGQYVNLAVFRVAQEAINNIRKYAQCDTAWVHLKYMEDKVVLIVEDNGIGFDIGEVAEGQKKYVTFGQLGMQERAEDINGELEITSEKGKGSKVVLVVPLKDNPAIVDVEEEKQPVQDTA